MVCEEEQEEEEEAAVQRSQKRWYDLFGFPVILVKTVVKCSRTITFLYSQPAGTAVIVSVFVLEGSAVV